MKNIKKNILLAGAAILASASFASAQVVNVQFAGDGGGSGFGPTYLGVGAVGTGTTWNVVDVTDPGTPNASVASGTLQTSTGGTSSDTVTLGNVVSFNESSSDGYNSGALASGNNLMDSEALSPAQTMTVSGVSTFTIGGLTPGGTYNLYLYGNFGSVTASADVTTFTINGVALPKSTTGSGLTGQMANTPPAGGWVDPAEYVEFAGVTADAITGDISGTWTAEGGPTGDGPFNGLQIQAETPAVPEPSVAILLGLGLMGLIAVRRARGLLS